MRGAKARTTENGPAFRKKRIENLFSTPAPAPELRLVRGADGVREKSWISDMFERNLPLAGTDRVRYPFEQSPVMHAAVSEFAESVASLELRIWDRDPLKDKDAQEVGSEHPLVKLLRRPNPWMTWSRFAYAGVVHRKVTGEDLWVLLTEEERGGPGGRTVETVPLRLREGQPIPLAEIRAIFPVHGDCLSLECEGATGQPRLWRYSLADGQGYQDVPYWSAIHFADYNPRQPFRGLGAAEVAASDIHLEWQAYRYQDALLRNGGDPGGFLMFEGEPPSASEKEAVQAEADREFSTDNAGRVKVAWGKGTYHAHTITPRDLNYVELFRHSRERQASAVGTPLPAIGYLENATYNNIREAHREKWRKVCSYLRTVEEVMNAGFISRLDDRAASRFVARFDLSNVEALKEDRTEQLQAAKALAIDTGCSFAEAMTLLGIEFEPNPAWEVRFASGGVQTVEQVEAGPAETPDGGSPAPGAGAPDDESEPEEAPEEPVEAPEEDEEPEKAARTRDAEEEEKRAFEERRAYFKSHESEVLEPGEKRIGDAAEKLIDAYRKAAIKRLRAFASGGSAALANGGPSFAKDFDVDIFLPSGDLKPEHLVEITPEFEEWAAKFVDGFSEPIDSTAREAVRFLAFELGVPALELTDPIIAELLVSQKAFLGRSIAETLGKDVASAIVEALDGTETVGTLQQIIANHLGAIEGSVKSRLSDVHTRAQRIARTETGKAANTGRHQQMRSAGVTEIEWVSSNDEAVRTEPNGGHRHLDGQRVELGQPFKGADGATIPNLIHPHAPGAPAAQVINCRCADRAVLKDTTEETNDG